MPVVLGDGRKGLVLIGKEYDGSYYLMHHGIIGMKWGIRRTPEELGHDTKKASSSKSIPEETKARMSAINDCPSRKDSIKNLAKLNIPVEKLSEIKRLDSNADVTQLRMDINHRNEEEFGQEGREYNCPNCACAFEMTERGYDVVARRAPDGSNVGDIEKSFKNGHLAEAFHSSWENDPIFFQDYPEDKKEREEFEKNLVTYVKNLNEARRESINHLRAEIQKQGEGARGIIVVGWLGEESMDRTTMFHALNYKVESGIIMFYDTQSYRKCTGTDNCGFLYGCDPRELYYMQTNNLELDDSITNRVYSRGRGDK